MTSTSSEKTASFDVIVIGGGPGGELAAGLLGEQGLETALVENHLVGGECSYYACMPSKALLRPAEALAEVRRVPGARDAVAHGLDIAAVLQRRDEIVHGLDDSDQIPWLDGRNVTLVRGHGWLDGERRVRVDGKLLVARRAVVLAVGTGTTFPPVPGLAEAKPWTNREATTAHSVPDRLLVLGGGVVGVELAQAWASLGSRVTLIELFERLLVREEPFAGEEIAAALRARAVDVRTNAKAIRAAGVGNEVTLELEGGERITGDELLVAVGRRPLTGNIGLETVGLEPGKPVEVGDDMRVPGSDWLYAIGDVNGRALLTHMAKYQARIAIANILDGDERAETNAHGPLAPRVVFTDPQVAAVGHTLESAQAAGIDAAAVDHPTGGVAGSSFYGRNAPGTVRLIFDLRCDVLIGATFTGPDVAEMVHAATVAIVGAVPAQRLRHAVPAFPTRSEVWLRLLDKYARAKEERSSTEMAAA